MLASARILPERFLDSCCINDEEAIQACDHKQEGMWCGTGTALAGMFTL